jgi:hypothetical protein
MTEFSVQMKHTILSLRKNKTNMKTKEKTQEPIRKTGEQIVREKVQRMNDFLSKVDLDDIYKKLNTVN